MAAIPEKVEPTTSASLPTPVAKQQEASTGVEHVITEPPQSQAGEKDVAPDEAFRNLTISEKHAAEPFVATETSTTGPIWPETPEDHPLSKFFAIVADLVKEAGHNEVYGVKLSNDSPFHTKLILQKFLRANANDVDQAKAQLLETLKWRKEFDPVKAAGETFSEEKFGGLGYVLHVKGVPESANEKDVATFNIYGAVKDKKKTFGDIVGFLRWRVGLMERSVQALNLNAATNPIPNHNEGPDPYQGYQIHDYLQVSFLRQDPLVKAATKSTIQILGRYYPETLSRKFFVNVPVVMGWLYQAMKLLVAKETSKKFTVISYGNTLSLELGKGIPKEYGGETSPLSEIGQGMNLEKTEKQTP